jgi:hypothetical protein
MASSASHPLDKLPRLPTQVPPGEIDRVIHVQNACTLLMQLTGQFASAIMLFDFCMDGIKAEKSGQPRSKLPLAEWRRMAGRDAGMTMYHFGMTIETVRQFANKSPWLPEQIDLKVMREAKKLMNASFPGWDQVRHAIAHRADFFIDPAQSEKHRVMMAPGVTRTYWNRLEGRTFIHTLNGNSFRCEVSQETLELLVEIRRKFFSAFNTLSE